MGNNTAVRDGPPVSWAQHTCLFHLLPQDPKVLFHRALPQPVKPQPQDAVVPVPLSSRTLHFPLLSFMAFLPACFSSLLRPIRMVALPSRSLTAFLPLLYQLSDTLSAASLQKVHAVSLPRSLVGINQLWSWYLLQVLPKGRT